MYLFIYFYQYLSKMIYNKQLTSHIIINYIVHLFLCYDKEIIKKKSTLRVRHKLMTQVIKLRDRYPISILDYKNKKISIFVLDYSMNSLGDYWKLGL